MNQSRLSKLLAPLPDWLRILAYIIVYVLFFAACVACFTFFAGIVFYVGMVLFGTHPPSSKGFEVGLGILLPIGFALLLSLSIFILIVESSKNHRTMLIGLGITAAVSIASALSIGVKYDASILLSQELQISFIVFFSTFLLIFWLLPYLLNKQEFKTLELAEPIEKDIGSKES